MTNSDVIELEVRPLSYFSQLDESAFFEWLDKIPCVMSYKGRGDTLYIQISNQKLDEQALRELLALFYRYKKDMKQFTIFDRKEFSKWFPDKDKYWHEAVFGTKSKWRK